MMIVFVERDEAFLARINSATASGVDPSSIIINGQESTVTILDEDGEYGFVLMYLQTLCMTYVFPSFPSTLSCHGNVLNA